MEVYDIRTVGFIAGPSITAITGTTPDSMVGVIQDVRYALGDQSGTVTISLMQRRFGTVTGTLDVVTLSPSAPTIPITNVTSLNNVLAVVDPGHEVAVRTNTGSVIGRINIWYTLGRMRRP
ncbi:MAG: hypothetical protein QW304_07800 [Thermoproteota archaeon]